ncbi:hypothetical protein [Dermacoccus barathri]
MRSPEAPMVIVAGLPVTGFGAGIEEVPEPEGACEFGVVLDPEEE